MRDAVQEITVTSGSDSAPLAALGFLLLAGAFWLSNAHLETATSITSSAPTSTAVPALSEPAKTAAPPAKETIVVLRLGGEGKYWIDGRPATQREVRSLLKSHFMASKDTAVMVQVPASLASSELLQAMQLIHESGIQRVAATPLTDAPTNAK